MTASETVRTRAEPGEPPFNFGGRVALVTGAGRGIGRATARLLAAWGCEVAVNDVRAEAAKETVDAIVADGGVAYALAGDVSSSADTRALVDSIIARSSHLDFLVNNAGISLYRPILDCAEADWDAHVDIMAKGTFLLIKAAAPHMLAQRFGRIVNLGSYVAQFNATTKYFGPYCAAKFAVIGLTQVAAQELAPHVTVNAVGPGDVATEMMELEWQQEGDRRSLPAADVKQEYRSRLLLGEFEGPGDIAESIAFLCSPLATHITGSHLIVSGGLPYKAEPQAD